MKAKCISNLIVLTTFIGTILALSTFVDAASFASSAMPNAVADYYMPGEILVRFKSAVTAQERVAAVMVMNNTIKTDLKHNWIHIKLATDQTVSQALTAYKNNPNIEYVQPNYIYHITAIPNDPQYGQLWAVKNIGQTVNSVVQGSGSIYPTDNPGIVGDDTNIEPAWDHITDCSSIVVAVIDSGINYNHEDLVSNMWNGNASYPNHGWNYVDGNNDPMDLAGHGTHVSGIIGAIGNNAIGTTGVCWKASIMAVRVMDATGNGTTANLIQGINFAVTNGAKVINMSLAGGGPFDQAFSDSITIAQNADVVVVVAAGNNGADNDSGATPTYPCNFTQPNLVCVAALDQRYQLATFSNYGSTSVDVGAPGTNILSTWAGMNPVITDPLTSGWLFNTTTKGGWVYGMVSDFNMLLDPSTWPSGIYALNTDDHAYKSFDLSGANVATLSVSAYFNVTSDGYFAVADSTSGGDPFAVASPMFVVGPYYTDTTPAVTPSLYFISTDISNCISTTCTLGFDLKTGITADLGVGLYNFSISTLTLNSTSYNTENGTSMATPEVAGLATMLRSFNPQYTYADVVNAIEKGGRPTASLVNKTTTGNAIDVMSSLAYISPPTGLTATVQ